MCKIVKKTIGKFSLYGIILQKGDYVNKIYSKYLNERVERC